MMGRNLVILVVGTLPPPIGGTTVSLQFFVETLRTIEGIDVRVVNTGGIRKAGPKGAFRALDIAKEMLTAAASSDIVTLHISPTALATLGVVAVMAARLLRRPLVVHLYGGTGLADQDGAVKLLLKWVLRQADAYLAETKELVRLAATDGIPDAMYFPNVRPLSKKWRPYDGRPCRRFVFISHIKPSKGVLDIIAAAERFDESVAVDIFGTFHDGLSESIFAGLKRVHYGGVVNPENLSDVLCNYDAVLLPTYHAGEGYPGIILDAYNVGLPVIVTRWRALPEIVDDSSGLLVEPKDPDGLFAAMNTLVKDQHLYARLCAGAVQKRDEFSNTTWAQRFVDLCRKLCAR